MTQEVLRVVAFPGLPGPSGCLLASQGFPGLPEPPRIPWASPGIPEHPRAFLGLPGPLQASQRLPGPLRDSPGFPGPSRASPDLPGPPWASPGLPRLPWALPGLPGRPRASPGFPGPPRAFPGLPGPSRGSPGLPYRSASPVPPIQCRRGTDLVGLVRQVSGDRVTTGDHLLKKLPTTTSPIGPLPYGEMPLSLLVAFPGPLPSNTSSLSLTLLNSPDRSLRSLGGLF